MTSRRLVWLAALAAALCACSSSEKASSGASAESCHRQCDAQTAVMGCKPFVDLGTCKAMCDALAAQTPAACAEKFSAYYDCSAKAGFDCAGPLVEQKGGACSAEQRTFAECQNGGKKPTCQGADDGGFCPSVQCPCPSGPTPVSGFSSASGTCKCFDTTTCVDAC